MADPNIILTIGGVDERATSLLSLPHNRDRYLAPSYAEDSATELTSREATPAASGEEADGEGFSSRICLTFDKPPKNKQEFVFGTDKRVCDVLLGSKRSGISGRHFCITFDDHRRTIIKDLSRSGTYVSYDGQGKDEKRCKFTWILFPGFKIKVRLKRSRKQYLTFEIKLGTHETYKAEYQANVMSFIEESRNTTLPLSLLDIQSQETTAAPSQGTSQALSPRQWPLYHVRGEIGRGTFGLVSQAVDVSTGEIYAAKGFKEASGFEKEVEIMSRISHDNIVRFVDFTRQDWPLRPLLIMEFLSLGNLEDQHRKRPITRDEIAQVLHQGLQALEYLHMMKITHRDIKPENLLVRSRETSIHIKMADFGLSKDVSFLQSRCGTALYAAPEIWDPHLHQVIYTSAVDIWSLAVVALQYLYHLPKSSRWDSNPSWCEKIVQANAGLRNRQPEASVFILLGEMLELDYRKRISASTCLQRLNIAASIRGHDTTVAEPSERLVADQAERNWVAAFLNPMQELECQGTIIADQKETKRPWRDRSSAENPSGMWQSKRLRMEEPQVTHPASGFYPSSTRPMRQDSEPLPVECMYDAVIQLLRALRLEGCAGQQEHQLGCSSRLIRSICEQLTRLKLSQPQVCRHRNSEFVEVTAKHDDMEVVLTSLNISELQQSTKHLATHLLDRLQSSATGAEGVSSIKSQTQPLQAVVQPQSYLQPQRLSVGSEPSTWSIEGAHKLGLTYPSDLDDFTRLSGCSIPISTQR